jgi:hypothetical protein
LETATVARVGTAWVRDGYLSDLDEPRDPYVRRQNPSANFASSVII